MNKFDFSEKFKNIASSLDINTSSNDVIEIETSKIDNWEYRDRSKFELGNIEDLAKSIQHNTQVQPIIVIEKNDDIIPENNQDCKYVVIAGYRRWLACSLINVKVKAILLDKNTNFKECVQILTAENEKESISPFSKGIFYKKLLINNSWTQDYLRGVLGISIGSLSNLLSYSDIRTNIIDAVYDWSKVTPRTSGAIRELQNKGYENIIIENAEKIRSGIGANSLKRIIENSGESKNSIPNYGVNKKRGTIKVDINAISKEDYSLFCEEINELIKKYWDE